MQPTTSIENQGRYNLFSIKPYKNNLLTPGASYWIICIHLVIFVMASSEAIAWGYLGSLFGKAGMGMLAAAITFAFMFLIVWVIDVSFVTLDLSRSYYDKIILKKETERWVDNTRLGVGLLGRIAIVFVSLSISAPFLAQIVFKQDIDNEIERRNMATVSMVSDSMLIAKDEEIAALDSVITVREAALITETAGQGSSGNYGFGPVTRAMEKQIGQLRDERADLLQEKAVMAQTVQALTVEEFADMHNVDLIDNGVRTREEILSGLMENPEYRTAKTAITAFLAFIFAALVLLKLFQPRSVRIYYNEKLQDLYREYLAGHLNKWIAPAEQSVDGRSNMSPLRFEDWCVNTYSVVRNEDIKRRDSRKIYNLFKMKIEQLEEEKAEIKKLMEPVEREYDDAMTELNQVKIELLEVENEIKHNQRLGDDIERHLTNIGEDLKNNRFQGSDVLIAVSAKKEAEANLEANKNEGLALNYKRDLVKHRFDVKETDAQQVDELMNRIRNNYRDLQEKIDRERIAYTDLVVSGQVIDVPRSDVPAYLDVVSREAPAALDAPEEEVNPVEHLLTERTQTESIDDTLQDTPESEDEPTQFEMARDEKTDEENANEEMAAGFSAANEHELADPSPALTTQESNHGTDDDVDLDDEASEYEDADEADLAYEDYTMARLEDISHTDELEPAVTSENLGYEDDEAEDADLPWDEEPAEEDADADPVESYDDGQMSFWEDPQDELPRIRKTQDLEPGLAEQKVVEASEPVDFVNEEELKELAEAASLAEYEDDEAFEEVKPETDKQSVYFVDPALNGFSEYGAVGVDVEPESEPTHFEPEQDSTFQQTVHDFLREQEDQPAEEQTLHAFLNDVEPEEDTVDENFEGLEDEEAVVALEEVLGESDDDEEDHVEPLEEDDLAEEPDLFEADEDVDEDTVVDDALEEHTDDEFDLNPEDEVDDLPVTSAGEEGEESQDQLEDTILNKLGDRASRKGRQIRKGTFGNAFGVSE